MATKLETFKMELRELLEKHNATICFTELGGFSVELPCASGWQEYTLRQGTSLSEGDL